MKITESTVKKLMITGVKNLDPIAVMVEDFGPGQGKITITCFNNCWSYFWGGMGKENTIASFFSSCSNDYLAGKLKCGIDDEIDDNDEDSLTKALRTQILKDRRTFDHAKHEARDLWDDADIPLNSYGGDVDDELFYKVFGDDWRDYRPKKPNPDYIYLSRIIDTVKEAFAAKTPSS